MKLQSISTEIMMKTYQLANIARVLTPSCLLQVQYLKKFYHPCLIVHLPLGDTVLLGDIVAHGHFFVVLNCFRGFIAPPLIHPLYFLDGLGAFFLHLCCFAFCLWLGARSSNKHGIFYHMCQVDSHCYINSHCFLFCLLELGHSLCRRRCHTPD